MLKINSQPSKKSGSVIAPEDTGTANPELLAGLF
jgi:hypothetical protein